MNLELRIKNYEFFKKMNYRFKKNKKFKFQNYLNIPKKYFADKRWLTFDQSMFSLIFFNRQICVKMYYSKNGFLIGEIMITDRTKLSDIQSLFNLIHEYHESYIKEELENEERSKIEKENDENNFEKETLPF